MNKHLELSIAGIQLNSNNELQILSDLYLLCSESIYDEAIECLYEYYIDSILLNDPHIVKGEVKCYGAVKCKLICKDVKHLIDFTFKHGIKLVAEKDAFIKVIDKDGNSNVMDIGKHHKLSEHQLEILNPQIDLIDFIRTLAILN